MASESCLDSSKKAALNGGGVSLQIGQIKAGATITRKFHITHDGTLIFSAEQSERIGHSEIDASTGGTITVGRMYDN